MIKSRNISLSLEEATRLYSSGNLALQEYAWGRKGIKACIAEPEQNLKRNKILLN